MCMSKPLIRLLGQGVRYASKLRGGGSAFPGLVMEKLHPEFVAEELAKLPYGVVVVSGTNGKTTTTKMTVQLLESQGLKVFTNRTGSNFVRGVAAALLGAMSLTGKLDADIAVLELDEAHAVHFVKAVKPDYALLLNVLRDQLDRFGEIGTVRRGVGRCRARADGGAHGRGFGWGPDRLVGGAAQRRIADQVVHGVAQWTRRRSAGRLPGVRFAVLNDDSGSEERHAVFGAGPGPEWRGKTVGTVLTDRGLPAWCPRSADRRACGGEPLGDRPEQGDGSGLVDPGLLGRKGLGGGHDFGQWQRCTGAIERWHGYAV